MWPWFVYTLLLEPRLLHTGAFCFCTSFRTAFEAGQSRGVYSSSDLEWWLQASLSRLNVSAHLNLKLDERKRKTFWYRYIRNPLMARELTKTLSVKIHRSWYTPPFQAKHRWRLLDESRRMGGSHQRSQQLVRCLSNGRWACGVLGVPHRMYSFHGQTTCWWETPDLLIVTFELGTLSLKLAKIGIS